MKKIMSAFLVSCMLGLNVTPALAVAKNNNIKDIQKDYWAKEQIETVVSEGIMFTDDDGNFNPDKSMTRVEFVHALLKVLSNNNLDVNVKNSFKDITASNAYYNDILRSQQLGLVYGYPDQTFKPNNSMLRSETTSVISHITKDKNVDYNVLNQFTDRNTIPNWAKLPYAKSINYGIYVNYPDESMLEPNKNLTRAEGAVLLAKLKDKLTVVKPQYVGPKEDVLAIEHLSVNKKAPNNTVQITNLRKVINQGNVLAVCFDSTFESKKHSAGDVVNFVLPEALYTDEGTMLLPANTKLVAEVTKIVPPKKFNKNARVHLLYKQIVMPDGKTYDIKARPFTKDNALKEGPWSTTGKIALSTISLGIVGAGAGVGFAFIPTHAAIGTGLAIGIPVGCGVGLIVGLLTPGLNYKAKEGEQVMILLMDDAAIAK